MDDYKRKIELVNENTNETKVECLCEEISINYYLENGKEDTRSITLIYPKGCKFPIPVVFICHYGTDSNSTSINKYLKKGIGVVALNNITTKENAILLNDDLRFNNAVLEYLLENEKIDKDKIILTGGSAGGYTALMLSALHLNINSTIVTSAVYNVYFTFESVYKEIIKYSFEDFMKLSDDEKKKMDHIITKVRFPLNFLVFPTFGLKYDKKLDMDFAIKLSPINYSKCYTNNMLLMHYTSDVLVPIENLTRKYTPLNGKTIDNNLSFKLKDYDLKEPINKAFDETLNDYHIDSFEACKKENEIQKFKYNKDKMINIVIFDDGETESFNGHFKNIKAGDIDIDEYLSYALNNKKSVLTVEKLKLLIDRCFNRCTIFKSIDNDNDIFGSINKTIKNVILEINNYKCSNEDDFNKIFNELDDNYKKDFNNIMKGL